MNKAKIIDLSIIILIYLAVASFPYGQLIKNSNFWLTFTEIFVYFAAFLIILLFIKFKSNITFVDKKKDMKNSLYFLPIIFICASNYFYFIVFPDSFHFVNEDVLYLKIVLHLIIAVIEEIIFRGLLEANLNIEKPLYRILIASLLFGLLHFVNFFTTMNASTLIIPLYTFGLGIVLGLIYEYTGCIYLSIGLHFLFNSVNMVLFENCIDVIKYLPYILINVIVALVAAIYLIIIYLLILKKKDKDLFKIE